MTNSTAIIEYKCPCCGAALVFSDEEQQLHCDSCGNTFELDAVKAFNDPETSEDAFSWEEQSTQPLSSDEESTMQGFQCPSCGGEILTELTTAATFCPYCENPAIVPSRVRGNLRPDGVLPFKLGKDEAKAAFTQLCKGKPLLPKDFASQQRLEKISGVYVPFWLYDCSSSFQGRYQATRVRHWSDSNYNYTKTSYYLLTRGAVADFSGIPMDGSRKMDDAIMESIEPFDYDQVVDFNTAFLSGYLADKYDVEAKSGEDRVRQRVDHSINDMLSPTFIGYTSVIPSRKTLQINHNKARYVLLPVWLLTSRYKDKTYTFAMNGQTGKMTGTLPICPKRSAMWFGGVAAGVTALVSLLMLLL